MRKLWLHVVFTTMAYALAVLAVVGGAYFRAGLDIEEGMVSLERIRAPHMIENVQETANNRRLALEFAQRLEQIYQIDPTEWQFVQNNLYHLQVYVSNVRTAFIAEVEAFDAALTAWNVEAAGIEAQNVQLQLGWENERAAAIEAELPIPSQPVLAVPSVPPIFEGAAFELFAGIPMMFTEDEQQLLVSIADNDFDNMWAAVFLVAENMQINHEIDAIDFVTERAVNRLLSTVSGIERAVGDIVENIVLQHLRPNVIPDEELNRQRFYDHSNNYQHVWIQANQIIVDEGDVITEDIYFILGQFGMLMQESVRDSVVPMIGVAVILLIVFMLCIMYLVFYCAELLKTKKTAALLFVIFTLSLVVAWTFRDFAIPVVALMIFPMLVSLLLDRKAAIVLHFAMVLVCFFVVEGNLWYLFFYWTSGALICMFSRFSTERNKVFLVGLLVMLSQFVVSITVTLIIERGHALTDYRALLFPAGIAAICGMLSVIICTGSLPFWETCFGVVTPVKLLDLTNPTNLLLRRLTIEAPGTYHHSLIVANLAETAAYDIGANAHAARVGGYYHDVGKLKFPHYFAENLDGENPHDIMAPEESVAIIVSHVTHGLSLAAEHRLPQFVKDMIREHHGTTKLQYFYTKAKDLDPDIDEQDYRYQFVTPQTRESACVMLADSVEAAVRAAMPKLSSVNEVEVIIRNIIRGKLNDDQLIDSQLSIKDVTIIEKSFFRVLKGMYHERIAYPKSSPPVVVK